MREIRDDVARWFETGSDVALAQVTKTWGSSPRVPGSVMAVSDRGGIAGSVSGGCVEGSVIQAALDCLEGRQGASLERFHASTARAQEVGLSCGGNIEVLVGRYGRALFETECAELDAERSYVRLSLVEGPEGMEGGVCGLLVSPDAAVVVDAISGVTGAGKKASARTHFCFADENLEAYGVATHRHTPEIEQILGIEGRLVFTPHLAPLNRGLLSTMNLPLASDAPRDTAAIVELYQAFYADDPFVHVLPAPTMPKTSSVVGTNYAHVGLAVNERAGMLVAVGAIDNLGKGAASQAVQCANAVLGLPQTRGLEAMSVPV